MSATPTPTTADPVGHKFALQSNDIFLNYASTMIISNATTPKSSQKSVRTNTHLTRLTPCQNSKILNQ